jgi:hypothetical protein
MDPPGTFNSSAAAEATAAASADARATPFQILLNFHSMKAAFAQPDVTRPPTPCRRVAMAMQRNTPPVTHHLDNRIVKRHALKGVDHKRMRSSNSTQARRKRQTVVRAL